MQIILSPAKLMNFGPSTEKIAPTQPLFPEKTNELFAVYRKLSVEEIAGKMKNKYSKSLYCVPIFPNFRLRRLFLLSGSFNPRAIDFCKIRQLLK
jgi:hypothetical protein